MCPFFRAMWGWQAESCRLGRLLGEFGIGWQHQHFLRPRERMAADFSDRPRRKVSGLEARVWPDLFEQVKWLSPAPSDKLHYIIFITKNNVSVPKIRLRCKNEGCTPSALNDESSSYAWSIFTAELCQRQSPNYAFCMPAVFRGPYQLISLFGANYFASFE